MKRSLSVEVSSSSSSSLGKKTKPLLACNQRDWSGLPWNILLLITERLEIDDYVRFGAVCIPWRNIFLEVNSSNRPSRFRLPFLLVPPPPPVVDPHHRALYSPSTDKVYSFRLQVPYNKVCRGSSFGWLVTLDACCDCRIQLLNPFLNRIIHLPPPYNIIQQHNGVWEGYYLRKAVLSSDPCSSPDDFVVMAIMSRYHGLAFFKPGNTTWTSIGDDWSTNSNRGKTVVDVIFSHNTNQFCALHSDYTLTAINLLGDEGDPKLTQLAPQRPSQFCGFPMYLVEDLSSGDLFLVCKTFENTNFFEDLASFMLFEDQRSKSNIIINFNVFRLNTSKGVWIWTHIDSIGENIMFLGSNGSILRSARDCPGCEPNSIYYTDDFDVTFCSSFRSYGPPYDGLYNLKEGTSRPHYSSVRSTEIFQPPPSLPEVLPQAIWIEPTLKRCN